jgi:formylglycine-generating enzyme required for sulfatase activity
MPALARIVEEMYPKLICVTATVLVVTGTGCRRTQVDSQPTHSDSTQPDRDATSSHANTRGKSHASSGEPSAQPSTLSDPGIAPTTQPDSTSPSATTRNVCPAGMAYVPGGNYAGAVGKSAIQIPPLCIDKLEVTAGEYGDCMARGNCRLLAVPSAEGCNLRKPGRERHPMNCVPWSAAEGYCRNRQAQLPSFTYLVWAIHNGPKQSKFPWGDAAPSEEAACWKRAPTVYETCVVGSHAQDMNQHGIFDLAGNVAEWSVEPGRRRVERLAVAGYYLSADSVFEVGMLVDSEADDQDATSVGFRCIRKTTEKPIDVGELSGERPAKPLK